MPFAVDVFHTQGSDFRDAQAGTISKHEHGFVLDGGDGLEEAGEFFLAEDDREFLDGARERHLGDLVNSTKAVAIEEAEGTDGLSDMAPRDFPLADQVDLVRANVFRSKMLGGDPEVQGELADTFEVSL